MLRILLDINLLFFSEIFKPIKIIYWANLFSSLLLSKPSAVYSFVKIYVKMQTGDFWYKEKSKLGHLICYNPKNPNIYHRNLRVCFLLCLWSATIRVTSLHTLEVCLLLGLASIYWETLSSHNMRAFASSYCILFCPVPLLFLGGLFIFFLRGNGGEWIWGRREVDMDFQ